MLKREWKPIIEQDKLKFSQPWGGKDINNTKEEKESQRKRTNSTNYTKMESFYKLETKAFKRHKLNEISAIYTTQKGIAGFVYTDLLKSIRKPWAPPMRTRG